MSIKTMGPRVRGKPTGCYILHSSAQRRGQQASEDGMRLRPGTAKAASAAPFWRGRGSSSSGDGSVHSVKTKIACQFVGLIWTLDFVRD